MSGGKAYLNELALGDPPLRVSIDEVSFRQGHETWVDSVYGNDSTGEVGLRIYPFQTIAAAIAASSAGDTVFVCPGIYDEILVMKDQVSVFGVEQSVCILTGEATAGTGDIDLVTMAENVAFGNFTLDITSSPNAIAGLVFPGTSNATSSAKNLRIQGSGTLATAVRLEGTGTSDADHVTLFNVDASGSNEPTFEQTGNGTSRMKNCIASGGTSGLTVSAGSVISIGSSLDGDVGVAADLGAAFLFDAGTTVAGSTGIDRSGTGSFTSTGSGTPPPAQSAFGSDVIAAPTSGVIEVLALPPLKAEKQYVWIVGTVKVRNVSGGTLTLTLRCYRDGVEIPDGLFSIEFPAAADNRVWTVQYFDTDPGNRPEYTLQASANGAGIEIWSTYRLTAFVVSPS